MTVGAIRVELPAIEPAGRGGWLPRSFAQERLWLLEQPGGPGPGHPIPCRCRLRGELDREALRATFRVVGGEPEPRIAPVEESDFLVLEHDLGGHAEPTASPGTRKSVRVTHIRFTGVPRS